MTKERYDHYLELIDISDYDTLNRLWSIVFQEDALTNAESLELLDIIFEKLRPLNEWLYE